MMWFAALAILCFGFSAGFVIGVAYGVDREQQRIEQWQHRRRREEAARLAR